MLIFAIKYFYELDVFINFQIKNLKRYQKVVESDALMNIVHYLLSYGANELNKFQTLHVSFSIYMCLCNWVMQNNIFNFQK